MGYTPTEWLRRISQFPDRYVISYLSGGLYTILPIEGNISQEGVPLSEANLNHLETQYDEAVAYLTALIDLNKVKLPSPSASDYVTPSTTSASSEGVETDVQTSSNNNVSLYSGSIIKAAQRKTISSKAVKKLTFQLYKANSPTGNVTFIIRKVSDDTIIVSKIWGDASALPTEATDEEVSFDSFPIINEEVRLCVEFSGGDASNPVYCRFQGTDVKADEYRSHYTTVWNDVTEADMYYKIEYILHAAGTIDDNLASKWRPSPANEANAWCRWDTGALKILGSCRIYWGADAAYRPTNYDIDVSENGTDWTQVVNETSAPPASAWKEYSWNARYVRYIRLQINTHGASGTEIYEADYYSRITDRVAAEHGHGSGITPYLEVHISEGHPAMVFGDTVREVVKQKLSKVKKVPTIASLVELIEAQNDLTEFLVKG